MQDKYRIFTSSEDKFSKRLFYLSYPYLSAYIVFQLLPFTNPKGDKTIFLVWTILILSSTIWVFISCYKWASTKLTLISFDGDIFEIQVLFKNRKQIFQVDKNKISLKQKWIGGRPRVLRLSLFNDSDKLSDIYSGGKQKIENELDAIAFRIQDKSSKEFETASIKATP